MDKLHRLAPVLLLALIAGGCGSKSTGTGGFVCSPPCPSGTRCTENGCEPIEPVQPPDLSVGDSAVGACSPECRDPNPKCAPDGRCVACLASEDCAIGSVCVHDFCLPGCSDDARCGDGKACCGGACTDPLDDSFNCGGCGITCSGNHAAGECVNGACVSGACFAGWGDCNHDPADGCEANLHVDGKNCGACGAGCSIPNALAACSDTCYIAACNFGFDDCDGDPKNGCEKSILVDPKNCGGCGRSCPVAPHARNACVNASCQLTSCDQGFADCDGNPANGCEVNVFGDVANCGRCGIACGQGLVCRNGGCTCPQCNFANATSICVNNVCVIDKCTAGFSDCNNDPKDGCESATGSDPKNCGACNNLCPQQTPACSMGMCTNKLRTVPGFAGEVGPDYTADDWIQCVGILDKLNVDDLPLMNWAALCIDNAYVKLRLACGANANAVQYIDISRNVFATKLNAYPENGLIYNASFQLPSNQIYSDPPNGPFDPNNNRSWWVSGNGCDENSPSITINNVCTWDVANCFGQNIQGERHFYVYVHK